MKKRFLALLLSLLMMLACATPFSVLVSAEGEPEYPSFTLEEYDALYIRDGLVFHVDFFSTNEYWGGESVTIQSSGQYADFYQHQLVYQAEAEEGAEPPAPVYYPTLNVYGKPTDEAFRPHVVSGGKVALPALTPNNDKYGLSASNVQVATDYAVNGATMQIVSKFGQSANGVAFMFNDTRYNITSSGSKMIFKTIGTRNDADGLIEKLPTTGDGVVAFDLSGKVGDYTFEIRRPASTQTYYAYDYAVTGAVPPTESQYAGVTSTTRSNYYYVTHTLNSDGTLVPNASCERMMFAFNKPIYYEHEGQKYIIGSEPRRTTNNGIGMGENGNFLHSEAGMVSLFENGKEIYRNDAAYFIDNNNLISDNYIQWGGRNDMDLYALRYYNRTLSASEIRYNHLIDLCKFFRLDASPITTLHENDLIYLADRMMSSSISDGREAVLEAYSTTVAYLLRDSFVGSGAAYEAFLAAVASGEIDTAKVRLLTDPAIQAEIFTAYADFVAANATADAAARQAAIDSAVDTALRTHYADYYGKTPELTAEQFFAEGTRSEAAEHFFKIAERNGMDMTPLVAVDPVIREYVYQSFADVVPEIPALTPVLADRMAKAITELTAFYYGEAFLDEIISFYGYQLTTWGDTGARAVYTLDEAIVADLEARGYTLTVGILFRTGASSAGMTLVENGGTYAPTNASVINKVAYTTGADNELFELNDNTCFTYEYLNSATGTKMHFTAYVILERDGNDSVIEYYTAKANGVAAGPTMKNLAEYCKSTLGYVAPNIQMLTAGRNKGVKTSIYLNNFNLSEYTILAEAGHEAMITAFNDAIKEATDIYLATAEEAAEGARILRFAIGDTASITLDEDGNATFTYPADSVADVAAALAAALANTINAGTDDLTIPVAFLVGGQVFN